jgi:hypothetical protein
MSNPPTPVTAQPPSLQSLLLPLPLQLTKSPCMPTVLLAPQSSSEVYLSVASEPSSSTLCNGPCTNGAWIPSRERIRGNLSALVPSWITLHSFIHFLVALEVNCYSFHYPELNLAGWAGLKRDPLKYPFSCIDFTAVWIYRTPEGYRQTEKTSKPIHYSNNCFSIHFIHDTYISSSILYVLVRNQNHHPTRPFIRVLYVFMYFCIIIDGG